MTSYDICFKLGNLTLCITYPTYTTDLENNTRHGCDKVETRRIPGSNARWPSTRQHTCQCFEVSASFDTCQCRLGLLLASAFRLPAGLLYQVYQRVQFYLENVGPYRCNRYSAISE